MQQSIENNQMCQIHNETFGIKSFTKTHKLLKKTYSSLFLVVDLTPNQGNCSRYTKFIKTCKTLENVYNIHF